LPVEDSADVDLGTDEKTFAELDRAAAKAEKALVKRNSELKKSISNAQKAQNEQKRLDERGGIFAKKGDDVLPSGKAPRDVLPISDAVVKARKQREKEQQKIQKNLDKIQERLNRIREREDTKRQKKLDKLAEKVRKDEVRQLGDKETILDRILGKTTARNLMSIGKNPKSFMLGIMKALPILGGVLAAKDIADFIIDEIVKLDKFLKVFIDEIDKRLDPFRTLLEQAFILAGLSQRIITTASGSVEPRYAYNTFNEFNTNQIELEEKFQMTNNSGVE